MSSTDIVIIGGGIIGVSIAYQLALRGATNVVLLERGAPIRIMKNPKTWRSRETRPHPGAHDAEGED